MKIREQRTDNTELKARIDEYIGFTWPWQDSARRFAAGREFKGSHGRGTYGDNTPFFGLSSIDLVRCFV